MSKNESDTKKAPKASVKKTPLKTKASVATGGNDTNKAVVSAKTVTKSTKTPAKTPAKTKETAKTTGGAKAEVKETDTEAVKAVKAVKDVKAVKAVKAVKEVKGAVKKSTKVTGKKAVTKKAVAKKTKVKATKVTKAKKVVQTSEQKAGSNTRYFKLLENDKNPHGRYSGSKPKQAAAKALTSIIRTREESGNSTKEKIKFSIVECTRGSRHKKYNYVGERIELTKPMEVTIGTGEKAKVISYKFNNKVMKDKL
jgi:hypothetical protein